jgi:glycosyltransferase involved in cell wall biosynthesis
VAETSSLTDVSPAPAGSAPGKVSIVVCSYNQGQFIRDTLESLLNQQDIESGELEIIVIDGGSTDGSREIIEEYADKLAFFVSEPDRGQTHALKKGFGRATGDILGWLCSDDLLHPYSVRFVLDYFRTYPGVSFIYGDANVIGAQGELLKIKKEIPFNWFIWKYAYNYISQPSAFWRRDLYEAANGLDESFELNMDGDLFGRFAERTHPLHIKKVLSSARWYPQQKTRRMSRRSWDEHEIVCLRYGSDLRNGLEAQALKFVAKSWRVLWKLATGCYY